MALSLPKGNSTADQINLTKQQNSTDKNNSPLPTKTQTTNQPSSSDNAAVHPNLVKLLTSQPAELDGRNNISQSEHPLLDNSPLRDGPSDGTDSAHIPTVAKTGSSHKSVNSSEKIKDACSGPDDSLPGVQASGNLQAVGNDGDNSLGNLENIDSINTESTNETADINTDEHGSNLPPSSPADPWHLAYTEMKSMAVELKSMGKKMSQLDTIERDVGSLKNQVEGILGKTKELEKSLQDH